MMVSVEIRKCELCGRRFAVAHGDFATICGLCPRPDRKATARFRHEQRLWNQDKRKRAAVK